MKSRLLYIDDEKPNLMLFELIFSNDIQVLTAINGSDGLKLLRDDSDISHVICDLRMPHMDGIELIKKAKSIRNDIKYFLLTGFELNDQIKEVLDNGLITDYFKKPFNKSVILDKIGS